MPEGCIDAYKSRIRALNSSLATTLEANLSRAFEKIRFPFEDSINYKSLSAQLDLIISLLRSLRDVYYQLERDEKCVFVCNSLISFSYDDAFSQVIELVIELFIKRFNYHFYGSKPTNDERRPEWFFTQVLTWIGANSEFFEAHMQTLYDEVGRKMFQSCQTFAFF